MSRCIKVRTWRDELEVISWRGIEIEDDGEDGKKEREKM